jgi:AcrR family transcriptional regulator
MPKRSSAGPPLPVSDAVIWRSDKVSARKREILEIAARLFAQKGYRGTSIRDIAEEGGVHGGSLYHHIKSKDALFIELHNTVLDLATDGRQRRSPRMLTKC